MPCTQITAQLDAYLDGDLAPAARARIDTHVADCSECAATRDDALAIRQALRLLPAADPRPGFFDDAIATARAAGDVGRTHGRSRLPFAVAAVLVVAIAATLVVDRTRSADPAVPQITVAIAETRSINLVFSSPKELADARVSLQLPQGLELEGFEAQREVAWRTRLRAGKNLLQLPVVAHAPLDADIVAHLEHGTATRTFRVRVRTT